MFTAIEYGLCLMWAVFAGLATWQCAQVLRQVTYVTLADGRRQERRIPFLFRLLFPLAPNLVPVFRRPAFEKSNAEVSRKLVAAGFGGMLTSEEFLAMKVLLPGIPGVLLAALVLALIALVPGRAGQSLQNHSISYIMIILLGFYAYPALWLRLSLIHI